jgi:uncharacterized protein
MVLSRYLKVYPSRQHADHFLLYSTLRGSTVQLPGAILRAAQGGGEMGAAADTLKRLGLLVEDPVQEREQMRTMLDRANSRIRRFSAVAVLNLDCNLDCGYCFEGSFRREQYMSQETAQLLVDALVRDRMATGKDVSITFYGGEPLLSEDLIRSISLQLQEQAELHQVKYRFDLVTNGTFLNRKAAERLIPLGLSSAKFTLDGPRQIHDRQRPYCSGSGSYDTIVENLAAIYEILPIQLGGNFYEADYRSFPRLLDDLIARGIKPEKIFQVIFTPVTRQAGCAEQSSGCASSGEPWLVEALSFLREAALVRGFQVPKPTVSACVVELTDTVVVNYDGTLYKCATFMGWDGLSIGTLAGGIADYAQSHRIGNWQNEECLECPYLPICFGGCRFMKLLQGKDLAEVDCRREFLDATLERFILQDMAYPRITAAAK